MNINNASKEELIKEITSRSLEPASTSHALRSQARAYNKALKMPTISETDMDSSDSDSENQTVHNPTIIKHTKIIYRESPTINVENWKIKFDGKSSVREFLSLIEEKCRTKNFSHDNLVRVFPDLLDGLALLWFRAIYHSELKWDELSKLLVSQFEAEDLQTDLKVKLFNMKQPKGMSVLEFSLRMKSLNNMLEAKLPEQELLRLAKKALLPMYTNLLVSRDILTFEQLTTYAGKLESFATPQEESATSPSFQKKADANYGNNMEVKFGHNNKASMDNNTSTYRRTGFPQNNYRRSFNNNTNNAGHKYSNTNDGFRYNKPSSSSFNNNNVNTQGASRTFVRNQVCLYCNKPGHVVADCRKKAAGANNSKVGGINNNKSEN